MIMYVNNILILFLLVLKFDCIFHCFYIETEIFTVRAHYNPRLVCFKPTFERPHTFGILRAYLKKFWPYVRLVFKSGL
jgi:hypothetical protein